MPLVRGDVALVSKRSAIDIPWHAPSEQPYVVADKRLKRLLRRACFPDFLKALATFFLLAPIISLQFFAMQRKGAIGGRGGFTRRSTAIKDFLGIAVALDSCDPKQLQQEIQDLAVRRILLRIPAWESADLQRYHDFMNALPQCEFTVCIMQNRDHVINPQRWQAAVDAIVEMSWSCGVRCYQLGQGANRSKWGFFSMDEFLQCAAYGEVLRKTYTGIHLIGPGVLDFEIIPTLRALVHGFNVRWDAVAASLYVDRRGSPRNTQSGIFDLRRKIDAIIACALCSKKIKRRLWITEVNWPLAGQGEYSPCSEDLCVSEETYSQYMREYIEDAWHSQRVERVYWWQLVAKGYGLIDVNDDGTLRKRPAYKAFKQILAEGV